MDNDNAGNEDPSITVAKINALQAITGALIVGLFSVLTTLLATGHFQSAAEPQNTSGDVLANLPKADVLNAPHIGFSSKEISLNLDQCMENATQALNATEYGGLEKRRFFAWVYHKDITALIWCHVDQQLVIFFTAGKEWQQVTEAEQKLRRLFRPN
ncbi:MAG: hypothetical protein OQK12_05385 [Motiliproteus sp.]|nr:hypothetical protein [Motiliproteus sp.]MCW9053829.1 hypothetical protein [Motiliproteus sp.]